MILLLSSLEEGWEMRPPINKSMMRRIGEGCAVKRIDMRPHPIILLLRDQSFSLHQFLITLIILRLFALPAFPLHKRNIILSTSLYKTRDRISYSANIDFNNAVI